MLREHGLSWPWIPWWWKCSTKVWNLEINKRTQKRSSVRHGESNLKCMDLRWFKGFALILLCPTQRHRKVTQSVGFLGWHPWKFNLQIDRSFRVHHLKVYTGLRSPAALVSHQRCEFMIFMFVDMDPSCAGEGMGSNVPYLNARIHNGSSKPPSHQHFYIHLPYTVYHHFLSNTWRDIPLGRILCITALTAFSWLKNCCSN